MSLTCYKQIKLPLGAGLVTFTMKHWEGIKYGTSLAVYSSTLNNFYTLYRQCKALNQLVHISLGPEKGIFEMNSKDLIIFRFLYAFWH